MFRLPTILHPKSLRQRTTFFVLLPTLLILLAMSLVSLLLVQQVLQDQWRQTAIAMLQATAYQVDMRLMRPKRILTLLQGQAEAESNRHVSGFLLDRLRSLDGVTEVSIEWTDRSRSDNGAAATGRATTDDRQGKRYRIMEPLEITTPLYDGEFKDKTVTLFSGFIDSDNGLFGQVEVKIAFYDLIKDVLQAPWWKNNKAFLVDSSGNVLSRANPLEKADAETILARFGEADELEKKTLEMLRQHKHGAVFGPGMPPAEQPMPSAG